ncbi:hypothetical protein Esti_002521 [Eimeria stiedai]
MRQQLSQQQQQHRREQQQLRHQQLHQHQQEQSAGSPPQSCTSTDAREVSARDMPAEAKAPQYSLTSGALALFAPSTRTPSPTRRFGYSKFEERSHTWRACNATPATSSRTFTGSLKMRGRRAFEALAMHSHASVIFPASNFVRYAAETTSHSETQLGPPQHSRKHQSSNLKTQTKKNQRAGQRTSEGGLPAALTSQQDSTDTSTIFAQLHQQHQQHGRTIGGLFEQIRGVKTGTTDVVHRQRPDKQASEDAINLHSCGCHRAKLEKGKKGSGFWKKRKNLGARQRESADIPQYGGVSAVGLLETAVGDSWSRCSALQQKASAHGGALHADCLLNMSPLLLAKVLQMLPGETAKAFGSTCRKARQLLYSYCCIVSLSARNVSCLLSLPSAVLKRQLPFFSGVKTIDLELSPAIASQLCLGSAAAPAAAVAGESLRTRSVVNGRGSSSTMIAGREMQAFTNQRADSRERHHPSAEGYRQYHQQGRARARDSPGAARCDFSENRSPPSHPHYPGLFRPRGLDLMRLQPLLADTAAASGDTTDAAVDTSTSHWSTAASARASTLLEHLSYLKSISARLKLAVSGSPRDSEAATELLLLLQLLIHRNAQSLVSLKIAVDVPPSSVGIFSRNIVQTIWRRIPPLLLPPLLPVLKSLHIDFPFQVTSNISISLGFSNLSIHSAHRLMLMKTNTLWQEPKKLPAHRCLCSCTLRCGQRFWGRVSGGLRGCMESPQAFMSGRTATVEVCDNAFELLEAQMGEDAPAAFADEAVAIDAVTPAADSKVAAYLLLNDDCMVVMHQGGSISFIRRKARTARGSPRQLPKEVGLPFSGQAAAIFRRGVLLLSELSAISGGTVLYGASPGVHRRALEASDASSGNMTLAERQPRAPPRLTSSLPRVPAARILHHPGMSTTVRQQRQQQQERQTQQLLVRALQHLVGIAAESLQLLDIDGEVRHFSVLYEKLDFKCLRRLSLGWTITPELHQLLCLFSSRKLRSLQKLNFNGPAQIHPDSYIHISYAPKVSKTSNADHCDVSWLEPLCVHLDEATLRRSAGLNNYGLGQIHLQLYALLNCGSCSVSQTEYARQQLLQQQLLLLRSEKNVNAIVKQIQEQMDPFGLDELDTSESGISHQFVAITSG